MSNTHLHVPPRVGRVSIARAALTLLAFAVLTGLGVPNAATAEEENSGAVFEKASTSAQADLQAALAELRDVRETIAAEKLPLSRKLRELENRLVELRGEYEEIARSLDNRNLDLNALQAELKARKEEKAYLQNLLDEYARNFETALHVSELALYEDQIQAARRARDDSDMTSTQALEAQADLIVASLDRLDNLLGGATFDGSAVAQDGTLKDGTFALIGPLAVYRSADGASIGIAEQRLGSLEPNVVALDDPALVEGVTQVVSSGKGQLPFDPTLGNAHKIEATEETFIEHVSKGGPVMVPILGMAFAALIVALIKWVQIANVRTPSRRRIDAVLTAVKKRDLEEANAHLESIKGPAGEMLKAGLEHINEPKDLIEEVMFEKLLETRLKLQGFLPFIAITASAAPLLGLLGTVTGMISTFKLISVFGAGDAQDLSSGISEALVTTEFGLIVAIPSLLLYAYLSRRARGMIDAMEKTAISFVNRLGTGNAGSPGPDAPVVAPQES